MAIMALSTRSKSINSADDQSMCFWGICCESGKQYAQVVEQKFHVTMAVLDPKSSSNNTDKETVSLIVIRGGIEYLLCVLKHEVIHQVNLNLIFDKKEKVIFYINGQGKVYLSGYQQTNDENAYLCPLEEVKSPDVKTKKRGRPRKTPMKSKSVTPKSEKKEIVVKKDSVTSTERQMSPQPCSSTYVNEPRNDDELINCKNESDEEFFLGFEDIESDDDDDDEENVERVENKEASPNLKRFQIKRKVTRMQHHSKRSRNESLNSSISNIEKTQDVCYEESDSDDDENSSGSDAMNLSSTNIHTPENQMSFETSTQKKKSKEKRLSEISNLSECSAKIQLTSPVAESTPNKNEGRQMLEGGVQIEDVVMGRGPPVTKGQMVHVFYVGRFQNKTVFDARVPDKDKPFRFKIGAQQIIKGFDLGVEGMQVGGLRKIKVPPNMGFGSLKQETIPPNSTLYYTVELNSFQ